MRQLNSSKKEVHWVLQSADGLLADKGVATVKTTRFGYETTFEKAIEILPGDRLVMDWEYA